MNCARPSVEAMTRILKFASVAIALSGLQRLALRIILAKSLWFFTLAFGSFALGAAENADATRPLRLGIPEFATGGNTASLRSDGARLVDLLTARLSSEAGFELVERADLDRVLKESALSLSGGIKPEQAVRIGKMVRADWFALGSFLQIEATNVVLLKIVDAQKGTIRDLSAFPLTSTNLPALVEMLAVFVVSSKTSVHALSERKFLAFGAFEDLGVHSRYPDFPNQLRATLTRRYAGTSISVVERSQVTPLLNELRLGAGGLATSTRSPANAQPAFLIVDGLYQSFQDEQSKINMVLRLEPMGGRLETVALKELPGTPLETKIFEAIDRAVANLKPASAPADRAIEARAQLDRGKQLARIGDKLPLRQLAGLPPLEQYRSPRVAALTDAIHAFESVLLLDPENAEAKFYLATCLSDSQIKKVEPARDYWREVVASSTNAAMVRIARRTIAYSYLDENPLQALELILALKRETRDPAEVARDNRSIQSIYDGLFKQGKVSRETLLTLLNEKWQQLCETVLSQLTRNENVNLSFTFRRIEEDYVPLFADRPPEAQRASVGAVVADLAARFPKFRPYFVSGYVRLLSGQKSSGSNLSLDKEAADWKKQYLEILTQCEKNPAIIPAVTNFYSSSLSEDLVRFLVNKDYEMAQRVATFLQEHARKSFKLIDQDTLDLYSGYLQFQAQHWKEAIAFFDRIGEREVPTVIHGGPWGTGPFASARLAVAACRRQLLPGTTPQSTADPGEPLTLPPPKPVKSLHAEKVVFAVSGPRVWIAEETGISLFYPDSGELKSIALNVNVPRRDYVNPFNCIALAKNKVWIGTEASGLIGIDETTYAVTNYTVADGLLTPGVLALFGAGDRLWMGFVSALGGGVGYLDLSENRFVGMVPELPLNLAKSPPRGPLSTSLRQTSSLPRSQINAFAQSPKGRLWLATQGNAMEYLPRTSNIWQAVAMDCSGHISDMAANDDYIVLTCFESQGWSSDDPRPRTGGVLILDLKTGRCRKVSRADGLTSNYMRSVAIDGQKAWVGGQALIALLDLPSARVEKVWNFPGIYRARSLQVSGNDLWFSLGPALYRLSKNSATEPASVPAQTRTTESPSPVSTSESQLVEDLKTARTLLIEREESKKLYGTIENEKAKNLASEFDATLRRLQPSFPLLDPDNASSSNHFFKLQLNQRGGRFDGFRFRNTSSAPRNFGWIFALEQPSNLEYWYIAPLYDQKLHGFPSEGESNLNYTNAPWSNSGKRYLERVQSLGNGRILPGKEYLIWFTFRNEKPLEAYVGFHLFPTTEQFSNSRVIDEALGVNRK